MQENGLSIISPTEAEIAPGLNHSFYIVISLLVICCHNRNELDQLFFLLIKFGLCANTRHNLWDRKILIRIWDFQDVQSLVSPILLKFQALIIETWVNIFQDTSFLLFHSMLSTKLLFQSPGSQSPDYSQIYTLLSRVMREQSPPNLTPLGKWTPNPLFLGWKPMKGTNSFESPPPTLFLGWSRSAPATSQLYVPTLSGIIMHSS